MGIAHILGVDALDHILFILALVSVYQLNDFKNLLILITAFTIGHSLTLVLSTLNILTVESKYIEFLIPVTILLTAATNLWRGKPKANFWFTFFFPAFFGLIHGLGFSNYLKQLLTTQKDFFWSLMAFNLGIEVGQIILVIGFLLISIVSFQLFRFKHRDWIMVISGICIGASLLLVKDAIFW